MLIQADQDNIVHMVIFQRIDDYVVWAIIVPVIFLCNVVSDVFGQH